MIDTYSQLKSWPDSKYFGWLQDRLESELGPGIIIGTESYDYGWSFEVYVMFPDTQRFALPVYQVARPDINSKGYNLNDMPNKDAIVSGFIIHCKAFNNIIPIFETYYAINQRYEGRG